ncbi:Tetratricopeptide repeat-containing protein [Rickettsiales endosymbiont of Paramecium tredecaurelia]|uniref:tetratricopeptide repeat protein n=1 Tax=Candidatus Sarmatiella mevalonica TaxID=2770581 RepID=UPI0019224ED8|nr:tetratricopeptide repeat protein [Candidatus Sarmatiella mevalonica]MBL3285088.1 Tetratricopeptide repeat-containing protein [Candidatus Sarmatiella mevalonica]
MQTIHNILGTPFVKRSKSYVELNNLNLAQKQRHDDKPKLTEHDLHTIIDILHSAKCYRELLQYIDLALDKQPTNNKLYLLKIDTLLALNRLIDAKKCLQQGTNIGVINSSDCQHIGEGLYNAKVYDKASICFEQAVQTLQGNDDYPNDTLYHKYLETLINLRQFQKATLYLQRVVAKGALSSFIPKKIGIILLKHERYDEAAICFGSAIALDNKNSDLYRCQIDALVTNKKFYEAMQCFELGAKRGVFSENMCCEIGDFFRKQKREEDAMRCFNHAIDIYHNPYVLHKDNCAYLRKIYALIEFEKYSEMPSCVMHAIDNNNLCGDDYMEIINALEKCKHTEAMRIIAVIKQNHDAKK